MSEDLSSEERLGVLRLNDHERRWSTVDDKRICIICQRIISGRGIRIWGGPKHYSFGCPTEDCPGNFSHWFLYRPAVPEPVAPAVDGVGELDFSPILPETGLVDGRRIVIRSTGRN